MTRGMLQRLIVEERRRCLREDTLSTRSTPEHYGLQPGCEELLYELEDAFGEDFQHAMFVDDMEGLGLRDAIEAGDREGADAIMATIAAEYPRDGYDAFGNQFSGSGPAGIPN